MCKFQILSFILLKIHSFALSSITFALILGIFLSVISTIFKDLFIDKFILFISVLGMSLPSFFPQ